MYSYNLEQWLLFFFFYCFCGWVWECCYVSFCKRKWVNRGFMHGPFLPLYGSGAITILFLTLPVRESLLLIFILGMLGATILEYVTGITMEKLFHMRYWDYTDMPLNVRGYICLPSSLLWGVFSIFLIRVVHLPVEKMILSIPDTLSDILAFVLTVTVAVDFTKSFQEAMDLREILAKATDNAKRIKELEKDLGKHLEKRLDVVVAVLDDDVKQLREKNAKRLGELQTYIARQRQLREEGRDKQYLRSLSVLKRNPGAVSGEFAEALQEIKESIRSRRKK